MSRVQPLEERVDAEKRRGQAHPQKRRDNSTSECKCPSGQDDAEDAEDGEDGARRRKRIGPRSAIRGRDEKSSERTSPSVKGAGAAAGKDPKGSFGRVSALASVSGPLEQRTCNPLPTLFCFIKVQGTG